MKKLFIDIGGTHLRSEVRWENDVNYECISSHEIGLLAYIDRQISLHPQIDFIGISYAGQVNKGVIIGAPNINIDSYDIAAEVKKRYGVRLIIDNDLNCAVRAEAVYWKSENLAALYVGTGIGAAVLDQGKLIRGYTNAAFEIGHIPYKPSPLICGCGRNNCLELYASGSGITKWIKYYGSHLTTELSCLNNSERNDERSIAEVFEEAFLHAAGTLITLTNPEILVLGGEIIKQNPYLATLLHEKLNDYTLSTAFNRVRIEISALENGPLTGAKLLENSHG